MNIRVAVIETDVLGAKAWHSRCLECGDQTKRRNRPSQAIDDAKAHVCRCPNCKENPCRGLQRCPQKLEADTEEKWMQSKFPEQTH